jgi:Zn finger protein HypA/HybF involved in hydrogenase expression
MENYCEMCGRPMSEDDHDFCDICPNCLEEEVDL